jgi:hypothetical protein
LEEAIDESSAFIGGFQREDSLEGPTQAVWSQRERLAKIPPSHSKYAFSPDNGSGGDNMSTPRTVS